ncbi:MAG: hypothetical protein FWD17_07140 [Polyangiaceae bacterium]|nr:hypothetical protein [Polyangiaceae bacterium]
MQRLLPIAFVTTLVTSFSFGASAEGSWRPDGTCDGLGVEKRDVAGSSFDELRVTTTSGLDLQSVCDAIFAKGLDGRSNVRFKRREVLRQTSGERWVYEQIAVPWVSDRDYVMHTKLEQGPESGRCEVSFETQNDPSRPPVRGFVRIPVIRGHWSVVPTGSGHLAIAYQVFSDPGGGIPAFLARGGQRSAAVDFVKNVLARAAGR